MSGGYFQYDQYKIGQIADEVEQLIRSNDDTTPNDWGERKGRDYTAETIAEFRKGLHALRVAQIYAQRIDWLVSCDDGEDSFHSRLREDLADAALQKLADLSKEMGEEP